MPDSSTSNCSSGVRMQSDLQAIRMHNALLPGVSRTFALTIPQLPDSLQLAVTNAYLLCRIADTIEDDAHLPLGDKQAFHRQFIELVAGRPDEHAFSRELSAALSDQTPASEARLIAQLPVVMDVNRSLSSPQREALQRCISVMCGGMPDFQQQTSIAGLDSMSELNQYCYVVAGVVGEMLTELFCDYSPEIDQHRDIMMPLSRSFGQGLQMTNILKDFWEDRLRKACWLPRDVFRRHGLDLGSPHSEHFVTAFSKGIHELIGVAHQCLRDAMQYVKLIPSDETGIRRFCLWAIGMAVLTLQNIRKRPGYARGEQIKISRRAVRMTMGMSNVLSRSNRALSMLFRLAASGLPKQPSMLQTSP